MTQLGGRQRLWSTVRALSQPRTPRGASFISYELANVRGIRALDGLTLLPGPAKMVQRNSSMLRLPA